MREAFTKGSSARVSERGGPTVAKERRSHGHREEVDSMMNDFHERKVRGSFLSVPRVDFEKIRTRKHAHFLF